MHTHAPTVINAWFIPVMRSNLAGINAPSDSDVVIGVLALQGAFREHIAHFNKVPGVTALEVKKKEDLDGLDGLVIPGGVPTLCGAFGIANDSTFLLKVQFPIEGAVLRPFAFHCVAG